MTDDMKPGWRPIDTAPKDGTRVDLWLRGNESIGRQANCYFLDGKWRFDHGDLSYLLLETNTIKATHWYDFGNGKTMPDAPEVG